MNSHQSDKVAGIVIIGNEILSGKVHDTNSYYLAAELRSLGVLVSRIVVIPDDISIISTTTAEFSKKFDYVFTTGGVGPTHDDVTMEGIARGFSVKLLPHPELEAFFRARYGDQVNNSVLKMTKVPEGALVITHKDMSYPVITFKNVFILPGIPEYLREKFSFIKERFRSAVFHIKRFYLDTKEMDIAERLNKTADGHRDVLFGSYPVIDNPEYKIVITAESKSEHALNKAVDDFTRRLPQDAVVRIE
jgi:molybdenum cofactor synthesis domain-containing protein